ncbi:hypothetical protein Dimus_028446 [Dionaea muscipula]
MDNLRGSKWARAQNHTKDFISWFEKKVMTEGASDDHIVWLAKGPNPVAIKYGGYVINGYRVNVCSCLLSFSKLVCFSSLSLRLILISFLDFSSPSSQLSLLLYISNSITMYFRDICEIRMLIHVKLLNSIFPSME